METSIKRKRLACLALMICLAFSFLAGEEAAAAKVFKWRFQTHWPAASASYAPFKKFMEGEVRALTDGQLFIEVHPAGTFVPTKDLFDAWAKNTIQGGTGSTYWISHVPLSAVAGQCPLAFRELWEAEYFHFHMGFEDALKKVPASVTKDVEKMYEDLRERFRGARAKEMKQELPIYFG